MRPHERKVARVLLADSDLASRLALNSILSTAGYAVDGAASTAEASGKLDQNEYQLVLADLRPESENAGPGLLAYARQKQYRPATALLVSDMFAPDPCAPDFSWMQPSPEECSDERIVRISHDDVSYLLVRVAELISQRASRRIRRANPAAR